MKKTLTRAAAGIAAAGAIGASSLVAAPAQAAAPGDLQILGGVSCTFKPWGPNWSDGPQWQMRTFLGVKNIGGSTMTGVTVNETAGRTRWVPADKAKGTKTGELKAGQTAIVFDTKWKGCWPASISGYTIGKQVENPFNNAGFWQNVRRAQPKA